MQPLVAISLASLLKFFSSISWLDRPVSDRCSRTSTVDPATPTVTGAPSMEKSASYKLLAAAGGDGGGKRGGGPDGGGGGGAFAAAAAVTMLPIVTPRPPRMKSTTSNAINLSTALHGSTGSGLGCSLSLS